MMLLECETLLTDGLHSRRAPAHPQMQQLVTVLISCGLVMLATATSACGTSSQVQGRVHFNVTPPAVLPPYHAAALLALRASLCNDSHCLSSWHIDTEPCRQWEGVGCREQPGSQAPAVVSVQVRLPAELLMLDEAALGAGAGAPLLPSLQELTVQCTGALPKTPAGNLTRTWLYAFPSLKHLRVTACGLDGNLQQLLVEPKCCETSCILAVAVHSNRRLRATAGSAFPGSCSVGPSQQADGTPSSRRCRCTQTAGSGTSLPGRQLVTLSLAGNRLSGWLPQNLLLAMPHLVLLDLSGNALDGSLPADWGSHTSLTFLYLGANNLEGPLPCSWAQWTKLQLADLSRNPRLGSSPQILQQATAAAGPVVAAAARQQGAHSSCRWLGGCWRHDCDSSTTTGSSRDGIGAATSTSVVTRRGYTSNPPRTATRGSGSAAAAPAYAVRTTSSSRGVLNRLTVPRCWLHKFCKLEGTFLCIQKPEGVQLNGKGPLGGSIRGSHQAAPTGVSAGPRGSPTVAPIWSWGAQAGGLDVAGCSVYIHGDSGSHLDPDNLCHHGSTWDLAGLAAAWLLFAATLVLLYCAPRRRHASTMGTYGRMDGAECQVQRLTGSWADGPHSSGDVGLLQQPLLHGSVAAVHNGGGADSSGGGSGGGIGTTSEAAATRGSGGHGACSSTAPREGCAWAGVGTTAAAAAAAAAGRGGGGGGTCTNAAPPPPTPGLPRQSHLSPAAPSDTPGADRGGSSSPPHSLTARAAGQSPYPCSSSTPLQHTCAGTVWLPCVVLLLDQVLSWRLLLFWGVGLHDPQQWPSQVLLGLLLTPHVLVGLTVHLRLVAAACLPAELAAALPGQGATAHPAGLTQLVACYSWVARAPCWVACPAQMILLLPAVALVTLVCPLAPLGCLLGLVTPGLTRRYLGLLQAAAAVSSALGCAVLLSVLWLLGNTPQTDAYLDGNLLRFVLVGNMADMAAAWAMALGL